MNCEIVVTSWKMKERNVDLFLFLHGFIWLSLSLLLSLLPPLSPSLAVVVETAAAAAVVSVSSEIQRKDNNKKIK